jgi:hypothetical protein
MYGRRTVVRFGFPAFHHEIPNRGRDAGVLFRVVALDDAKHDCHLGELGKRDGSGEYLRGT